jgi:hypothetical protein
MTAFDSALSALRGHLGELETALALWVTRDDAKAQPDIRQAANDAIDAIDTAIRELYGIRGQLIPEVRASDDAATARAEELLRHIREERGQ